MHVGLGKVLLVLINKFAHLRTQLLSVGMTPRNVASEQISTLGSGPLLSHTSIDGDNLTFG